MFLGVSRDCDSPGSESEMERCIHLRRRKQHVTGIGEKLYGEIQLESKPNFPEDYTRHRKFRPIHFIYKL